jgi:hypothetical protein
LWPTAHSAAKGVSYQLKNPRNLPITGVRNPVRQHTLAILALALLTRLLILWFVAERFPHRWLYSRGIELGTLAQSLLAGQGLSIPFPTGLLDHSMEV